MRPALAILVVLSFPCGILIGRDQNGDTTDTLARYFQFEDPPFLGYVLPYFPPTLLERGVELKAFIRSGTFRALRVRYGDARAVDAIYVRAMCMANDNAAMALLMATVATFDHRLVGLKVPVLQLYFPLSNESVRQFSQRVDNLPSRLYDDSPPIGDRD